MIHRSHAPAPSGHRRPPFRGAAQGLSSALLALGLAMACAAAPSSRPGAAPSTSPINAGLSREALLADLAQMASTLAGQHPAPFTYITEPAFRALEAEIATGLREGMDALAFYRAAAPLAAAIGCVHSYLAPTETMEAGLRNGGGRLPLEAALVGGRLHVIGSLPALGIEAGDEILAIEGSPAADILARIEARIAADRRSAGSRRDAVNAGFNELYLRWIGAATSFRILLRGPTGTSRELSVPGISSRAVAERIKRPRLPYTRFEEPAPGLGYLRIGDFEDLSSLESLLDASFRRMAAAGTRRLVLDLRGNGGGAPQGAAYLLSGLLAEPFTYFARPYPGYEELAEPISIRPDAFKGELLVLMDGLCSSTTGHLLSLLRQHRRGLLIGTESGGTWTCHDYGTLSRLRNTGLVLRVARRTVRTAVEGMPTDRGIMPDLPLEPSLEAMIAGRDEALGFAMEARL